MALFTLKTLDGKMVLDTTGKTINMLGQGGTAIGSIATVDTAGNIQKRITVTRLVVLNIFALALQKKKDDRELYILVEGEGYSMVARVDPKEGANTRKFAAAINTLSRGGVPLAMSLGGAGRNQAIADENRERRAALTPEARAAENKRNLIIAGVVVAIILVIWIISAAT